LVVKPAMGRFFYAGSEHQWLDPGRRVMRKPSRRL
jgi:hypothetical protein